MSILKFALEMILPVCALSMKELLCTQCIFLRTIQCVEIIFGGAFSFLCPCLFTSFFMKHSYALGKYENQSRSR